MVDVNHLIDLGDFQSCFIPIKGLIVGYFAKNGRTFTMKSRFFFAVRHVCFFLFLRCQVESGRRGQGQGRLQRRQQQQRQRQQ